MKLLEILATSRPLVADGAWGTQLMARGLAAGASPELYNVEHPTVIEEISRAYLEAGAEILSTNSFGGSPLSLDRHGLGERCAELNRAAVEIVRRVAGSELLVAASIGPTGRVLEPYGDCPREEAVRAFRTQIAALAEARPDLLVVETMIDLGEATLALTAARDLAPHIPCAVTMTFDATPRGFFTAMGVTVEQAASELADAGAHLVGANCGSGVDTMVEIAAAFTAASDLPVLIQSNAGLPTLTAGELLFPDTPEHMAAGAQRLADLGVAIIGGCCGTTPEHIRAIRRAIDAHRS